MLKHPTAVPTNMDDAVFITVEGIDGSGTTTAVEAVAESFSDVLTTAEPAEQHWTGRAARRAITDDETHPMTEFHFFIGDRAYHLENTVRPALERGQSVVSDRYFHSTLAYQQENLRGVVDDPLTYIMRSMEEWVDIPDHTILLDVPVEVAAERRGDDGDKYEASAFQRAAADNYRDIFRLSDGVTVVDASRPEDEVTEDVLDIVAYTL